MFVLLKNAQAQVAPLLYYTFDTTNPYAPAVGTGNLSTGGSSIAAGAVGNCVTQLRRDQAYTNLVGGNFNATNAVTIQLIFKGGYHFLNNRKATMVRWGNTTVSFGVPAGNTRYNNLFISGRRTGATGNESMQFDMDGIDRKSLTYYVDEAWHHLALIYNPQAGQIQAYVDGLLTATQTVTTGTIALPSDVKIYLNSSTQYDQFLGYMDEIAFYNVALSSRQIYQNYLDFQAGNHYTTALYGQAIPSTPILTAPLDTMDFPVGYVLGSGTSANIPTSALNQIKESVSPRYPSIYTLKPHFNWCNPMYVGGRFQTDISNPVQTSYDIQYELSRYWHYSLIVSANVSTTTVSDYTDTTDYAGKWVKLSKADTSYHTSAITFWKQSGTPAITSKTLPSPNYYLRNSSGQYLTQGGAVISPQSNTSQRALAPSAPQAPMSSDGVPVKTKMTALVSALSPNILDMINENAEVIPLIDTPALYLDPAVIADTVGGGFTSGRDYYGARVKRFTLAYRDTILSAVTNNSNVGFSVYAADGQDGSNGRNYYRFYYEQYRKTMRQFNGRYYSTFDFYPRYPWNYRIGIAADRGIQDIQDALYTQLLWGDKVMSPFISAGWNTNEELNMRPGRYLGLLKLLCGWGSDFFYPAYFNIAASYNPPNPPPAHPKGYIWQLLMPSYAQGVAARYEDILYTGTLLSDMPSDYTKSVGQAYCLWSGDPRVFTVARRDSLDSDHYIITTNIQPSSNQKGNIPYTKTAKFIIGSDTIRMTASEQGSVYELNKSSKRIRQLDFWHQWWHPQRWLTNEYLIEAEVYDSLTMQYATETITGYDFTSFLTYGYADTAYYYMTLKDTATYYCWVKAKLSGGSAANMNITVEGATLNKNIQVTTPYWAWYRFSTTSSTDTLKISATSATQRNTVALRLPSNVQVDKVYFTTDDTLLSPQAPGGGCATITVSITGANVACNGAATGTRIATPSGGTSPYTYLWSTIPSQTTQTASGLVAGSYTVTVTDNDGCTGTNSSTVTEATAIAITPSSVPTTCGVSNGSASVSVSGGAGSYTYLWSTGTTTNSISSRPAGTYSVTVTDASGCTAQAFIPIANSSAATLSISSQTNVSCFGGSDGGAVIGTSGGTAPFTYNWTPSGGTSLTLSGQEAGTYTLTATDNSGCTSSISVTLTQPNVLVNAITKTNVSCNGGADGSITVTAAGGTTSYTYLWSNAATTATINNLSAGGYTVTITDANACTSTGTTTLTQPSALTATMSKINVGCSGGGLAVVTASGGTTPYTYLWSTGSVNDSITTGTVGTYTVTVTDENACTASGSVVLISCDTTCTAPPSLVADYVQSTRFRLTYTKMTNARSYEVLLTWNDGANTKKIAVDQRYNRILVQNLKNMTKYTVRVRCYCFVSGVYQYSDYSVPIVVITKP